MTTDVEGRRATELGRDQRRAREHKHHRARVLALDQAPRSLSHSNEPQFAGNKMTAQQTLAGTRDRDAQRG